MKRLAFLAVVWTAVAFVGALAIVTFSAADAQDADADRIAALETQVAQQADLLLRLAIDVDAGTLPPPVPAADIGYYSTGQSFTAANAFRIVCRIGDLNTYYDLTCVRAEFP